jgi:uncharacterized coiled-coil protein SlyX
MKGELSEAAGRVVQLRAELPNNFIVQALELLLNRVLSFREAAAIKELEARLAKQGEQLRASQGKIGELNAEIARLNGELESARRTSEVLKARMVAGLEETPESAAAESKPRSFTVVWQELSALSVWELSRLNPDLAWLFTAEKGSRGRAISVEEIIDRRKQVIGEMIGLLIADGRIRFSQLQERGQHFINYTQNSRIFPTGYEGAVQAATFIKEKLLTSSD